MTIEQSFTEKITDKISNHRNRFYNILFSRYAELLPLVISYEHTDTSKVSIDKINLEIMLRQGYAVVIGELTTGVIGILGYIDNKREQYQYNTIYFNNVPRTSKDINFIISDLLKKPEYREITPYNKNGNFVVLNNKPLAFVNDFEIVNHYTTELTEIVVSRFSIIMQSKINTFLRDEFNSDDMENVASSLYNGQPWIKTSTKFDVNDHIVNISNVAFVSALSELKRTYQNILSELNSMLGLNSLGVDKESGVSKTEAESNRSFKKSNENIYLRGRNEPLTLLNEKYGTNIQAEYVDSMVSEISSLEKLEVLANV